MRLVFEETAKKNILPNLHIKKGTRYQFEKKPKN
jgi:hypothetical protein